MKLPSFLLNRTVAILHDVVMVPLAWLLAYLFRFNFEGIPDAYLHPGLFSLSVLMPVQIILFWRVGLYRGVWRFASIPDLVRIVKSVILGMLIAVLILFVLFRVEGIPRSVPILYTVLLVILLGGPRLLYRWSKDRNLHISGGKRVLIVGAGSAGEMLARDMLRSQGNDYLPVAFVDDKARRVGQDIHGIPVVGNIESIPDKVAELQIQVIVLAIPSARLNERKRLIEYSEQANIPIRTVPQLDNLMSGQVSVNQLREVSIEDLLGREPVKLEWDAIRNGLSARTILVSGAGGSIGSELCRQLSALVPTRLVVMDNSEFNLYQIEQELNNRFPDIDVYPCLVDVKDASSVSKVFSQYEPEIVFHAAAYKHVPLLEYNVREAVNNNVIGTRTIADAADRHGVSKFILISTDKAVNPTNVMGTTKRVAELYCQNLNDRSETRYITVRFGNVLGSAGSVVPLFRKQIEQGGPVTVTHEDIERYFMTIPEACQLIMQAGTQGDGGEIFVLDMGEPVKIRYLAEQMIRLSGRMPGEDIEITFTGLRPGEKLFEELFHEMEALKPTGHSKILLAKYRQVEWDNLCNIIDTMLSGIQDYDEVLLINNMKSLVPESKIQTERPTI